MWKVEKCIASKSKNVKKSKYVYNDVLSSFFCPANSRVWFVNFFFIQVYASSFLIKSLNCGRTKKSRKKTLFSIRATILITYSYIHLYLQSIKTFYPFVFTPRSSSFLSKLIILELYRSNSIHIAKCIFLECILNTG